MRWPRAVFDGRDARKGCSGLPGTSRAEQSDDHAVSRTAQIALSRRIALRHGAAPRPVLFGGGRGDQRPWSGGSLRLAHRGFYAKQAVKTIARGTPDVSGAFVATTLVCFPFLHTRLRTHRASGVPCALSTEGEGMRTPWRPRALKNRGKQACPPDGDGFMLREWGKLHARLCPEWLI